MSLSGIDICHWTVPTNEGEITYNVWDFAGQTVYYNTHQVTIHIIIDILNVI